MSLPRGTARIMLPSGGSVIVFTTALASITTASIYPTSRLFHATGGYGHCRARDSAREIGVLGRSVMVNCSDCIGRGRGPTFVMSNSRGAG